MKLNSLGSKLRTVCSQVGNAPTASDQRLSGRRAQARRLRMWTADPYCALCGRLTDYPNGFELDHRIALVNGGSDEDDNLQVLCVYPCHEDKTRRDLGQVVKQQIGLDGWPIGGGSRQDGGDPHGHQSSNSFPLIPDKKNLDVGGGLEASGSHRADHRASKPSPINRNTTGRLTDMGGALEEAGPISEDTKPPVSFLHRQVRKTIFCPSAEERTGGAGMARAMPITSATEHPKPRYR